MNGFWDDPKNWPTGAAWPAEPGGWVDGTVTRMELHQSRYGRAQLVLELDGDGLKRWCNGRLWRTLGDARVEVGERIRVTRGPDEPTSAPGAKPATTWTVKRIQPPAAPTGPPVVLKWGAAAAPAAQPAMTEGPTW
jgi:hypothetical protein